MMEYDKKIAKARKRFQDTVIRIDRKLGNLGSLRGQEGMAKRKRMYDLPNNAKCWINQYCQNAEKIWTGRGSHGAVIYVNRKLIEHPSVLRAKAAYLEAMEVRAEAMKARAEARTE
ncbi:hypothetical protein [Gemmobacter nectariphilus]|uniref:hypothetical protein n=1 Tax=Gemmobacter nectariphilus TaxID=220343 RepID=UPI001377CDA8|nr:hypothetical protein [Gemmobacter nectariphilus]